MIAELLSLIEVSNCHVCGKMERPIACLIMTHHGYVDSNFQQMSRTLGTLTSAVWPGGKNELQRTESWIWLKVQQYDP